MTDVNDNGACLLKWHAQRLRDMCTRLQTKLRSACEINELAE
jgi:hypothetical protein